MASFSLCLLLVAILQVHVQQFKVLASSDISERYQYYDEQEYERYDSDYEPRNDDKDDGNDSNDEERNDHSDYDDFLKTSRRNLSKQKFEMERLDNCPKVFSPRCDRNNLFRTSDGSCNNLNISWWGQSETAYGRYLKPAYQDYKQRPRQLSTVGKPLKSPREISLIVHNPDDLASGLTHMFAIFGQYVMFDMVKTAHTLGMDGDIKKCSCSSKSYDCLKIPISKNDYYFKYNKCLTQIRERDAKDSFNCDSIYREQLNLATTWLDQSNTYGNSRKDESFLREFIGGRLKVSFSENTKDTFMPSYCTAQTFSLIKKTKTCFMSGDERCNQNTLLTSIHTLWLREHNRIAYKLSKINKHWDDERLYRETRRIVNAIYQNIVYSSWLPLVIGKDLYEIFGLKPNLYGYNEYYDASIFPQTSIEFAAAAGRFGHTLVKSYVSRVQENSYYSKNESLRNIMFRPDRVYTYFEDYMLGLLEDRANDHSPHVTHELNHYLIVNHGNQNDDRISSLPALNIMRGREVGIDSYIKYRKQSGIYQASTFYDLTWISSKNLRNLKKSYRTAEDIDLFTGGSCENPVQGGVVGPTFAIIIAKEFRNKKFGDRFYFENSKTANHHPFTKAQLNEIKRMTLGNIICSNTHIKKIPKNVFLESSSQIDCDKMSLIDLDLFRESEQETNYKYQSYKSLYTDDNPCLKNPCRNFEFCVRKSNSYLGYECIDEKYNPCLSNPCPSTEQCILHSSSVDGFVCRHDNPCDPNPCEIGERCIVDSAAIRGHICQETDPCRANSCQTNETCRPDITNIHGFICQTKCDPVCSAVQQCRRKDFSERFECSCIDEQFEGVNCDKRKDACSLVKCSKDTVCVLNQNNETECINPCQNVLCPENLICRVNEFASPICISPCDELNCGETKVCRLNVLSEPVCIDPCINVLCISPAKCRIVANDGVCVDVCQPNPCSTGIFTVCVHDDTYKKGYKCIEDDPCRSNPCIGKKNKCIRDNTLIGYTCIDETPCSPNPCPTNSICKIGSDGDFFCVDPCLFVQCPLDHICQQNPFGGIVCINPCNELVCEAGRICKLNTNKMPQCIDPCAGISCSYPEMCKIINDIGVCVNVCNPNPCTGFKETCVPDMVNLNYTCVNENPCLPNPCVGEKNSCILDISSPDGFKCIEFNPCIPNPCDSINPVCVKDQLNYRCIMVDPCIGFTCPQNQICQINSSDQAVCVDPCFDTECSPAMQCRLTPSGSPVCVDKCSLVTCSENEVCILDNTLNTQCINPCIFTTCMAPSECKVKNKMAVCVTKCEPNPCIGNKQCILDSSLIGYKCIDNPCKPNPCDHGKYCVQDNSACGYTCKKPDACTPNPCYDGKECVLDYSAYGYSCKNPYPIKQYINNYNTVTYRIPTATSTSIVTTTLQTSTVTMDSTTTTDVSSETTIDSTTDTTTVTDSTTDSTTNLDTSTETTSDSTTITDTTTDTTTDSTTATDPTTDSTTATDITTDITTDTTTDSTTTTGI